MLQHSFSFLVLCNFIILEFIMSKYNSITSLSPSDLLTDIPCHREIKEILMARLLTYSDHVQRQNQKQVEQLSLSHLQQMLRKQQILKNKQKIIKQQAEQIDLSEKELRKLEKKIEEIETQMVFLKDSSKLKDEALKLYESKIQLMKDNLARLECHLEETMQSKQELEMQKDHYAGLIKKIRNESSSKVQHNQFLRRVLEQNLNQNFMEKINFVKEKADHLEEKYYSQKQIINEEQKTIEHLTLANKNIQEKLAKATSPPQVRHASIQTELCQQQCEKCLQTDIDLTNEKPTEQKLQNTCAQTDKIGLRQEQISERWSQTEEIIDEAEKKNRKRIPGNKQQAVNLFKKEESDLRNLVESLKQNEKRLGEIYKQKEEEILKIYESRPSRKEDVCQIQDLQGQLMAHHLKMQEVERLVHQLKNTNITLRLEKQREQQLCIANSYDFYQHPRGTAKQHFSQTQGSFQAIRKIANLQTELTQTEPNQFEDDDGSSQQLQIRYTTDLNNLKSEQFKLVNNQRKNSLPNSLQKQCGIISNKNFYWKYSAGKKQKLKQKYQ